MNNDSEATMAGTSQEWKALIPSCFGIADLRFARHPLDEARAKSIIKQAKQSGSNCEEIMEAIKAFLESEGASNAHIKDELKYARRLVSK
jgi:hypothetical protein